MDELATKLVDSLTKVENALETMTPTAFQALVEAAYISGVFELLWGALGVLVLLASVRTLYFGITHVENAKNTEEVKAVAAIAGGALMALIGLIWALSYLSDRDAWLAVINPTAYVVKTLVYH